MFMYRLMIALFVIVSLVSCANKKLTHAPVAVENNKKQPDVVVINWGKKAAVLPEDFWDKYRDTLIQQVGAVEYQYMKEHGPGHYPEQMVLLSPSGNMQDPNAYYKKMAELKYELAARYRHFNDQGSYNGMYNILRVPYSLNQNWDSNAKWDTVYFIFSEKAVQVKN